MENDEFKFDEIYSFNYIMEKMPGGFFIYHADGDEEIVYVNNAILRIFGCDTLEEFKKLTGYTFRGMIHPEDVDEVEKSIAEQIESNIYDLDYVEYRIKQKDGSTRWIEDYGHFVHTDENDFFYVFIEDATDRMRKRMEELSKMHTNLSNAYARESQYRKAIMHDAIVFFEVNLSKDEFITDIMNLMNSILFDNNIISENLSFSSFVRILSNRTLGNDAAEYKEFFNIKRLIRCYENDEPEQIYDGQFVDTFGRKRLMRYVVLIGKNSNTSDFEALIILKDITEQFERQNLLKVSLKQAQAANIARNTFLSNMSHDIRTPLNAILGFVDLIKLNRNDLEKTDEYLEKIKTSGKQLLSIVNEALEVTRMESGKFTLAETECHLIDLLAEVEKTALLEMNAKNITFTIDKSNVIHYSVYLDIIRIKEILCQLLDNAAKYTNIGGKVELIVSEKITSEGYGKYVFVVKDNGIGISEEFLPHIFEPFRREKNTTKGGIAGSGLGLTLVKSLVNIMDGDITIDSKPGQGTICTVSLILKQLEKNICSRTLNPVPDISLEGKRILLVEDNELNREIAKELLNEVGYIVETASDGDISVEMVKNSEPGYYSLILMDIQMPNMNGYDAARAIRALENRSLSNIPIIALSANTYAEDQKKSFDAGMEAHCPKPLDIVGLQNLIRNILLNKKDAV